MTNPETESRTLKGRRECMKLALQGRQTVEAVRKSGFRRLLIPDRTVLLIQECFDQAGESILQQDFDGALQMWETALQRCHDAIKQASKGWVGKLLVQKASIEKIEQLSQRFKKAAAQARRPPMKGAQSRIWENLALPEKGIAVYSFADKIRRLVVVTESSQARCALERFAPYVVAISPEYFFAEEDDHVYWPETTEPLLTPEELHAIFLALSIKKYAFVLVSFAPAKDDSLCHFRSLADNLVMSGACYNHLRRFGRLPSLGQGRICRFYRISSSAQWQEKSPEAIFGQPLSAIGRELVGSAKAPGDTGRLLHALRMMPLGVGAQPCVFVLLSSLDAGSLGRDRVQKLLEGLRSSFDVVAIFEGAELSQADETFRKAVAEYSVAVYALSELADDARQEVLLRCLAQSYRPVALFVSLDSLKSLAGKVSSPAATLSPLSGREIEARMLDQLADCAFKADILAEKKGRASSVLAKLFESDMGLSLDGVFAISSIPSAQQTLVVPVEAVGAPQVTPFERTSSVVVTEGVPLSVLICSTGRPSDLERCVHQCLAVLNGRKDEILVLDRLRQPGVQDKITALAQRFPNLKYVSLARQSASRARNEGASLAANEVVVFMDDEVVPLGPEFFEFHRAKHTEDFSRELFTIGQIAWPVDPGFPVDSPLVHLQQGVWGSRQISDRLNWGAWSKTSAVSLAVKKNIVPSWIDNGFFSHASDSRMVASELALRLHLGGSTPDIQTSSNILGEYCRALTVTDLIRRSVGDGIAVAKMAERYPELLEYFGVHRMQAALNAPLDAVCVSAASDCLSFMEGLKAIGNLLPTSADMDRLRQVRSALLELSYLQGFTIGSEAVQKNLATAYATILNQFFLRVPTFADYFVGETGK